jgi:hypothetical protein
MTMSNTGKKGISALFSPMPTENTTGNTSIEKREKKEFVQHSYRVPISFDDRVRDFHYAIVRSSGDINYKLIDLYFDAMELFMKRSKVEIQPRPDNIREKEKYRGRGASKKNKPKVSHIDE